MSWKAISRHGSGCPTVGAQGKPSGHPRFHKPLQPYNELAPAFTRCGDCQFRRNALITPTRPPPFPKTENGGGAGGGSGLFKSLHKMYGILSDRDCRFRRSEARNLALASSRFLFNSLDEMITCLCEFLKWSTATKHSSSFAWRSPRRLTAARDDSKRFNAALDFTPWP